MPLNTHINCSNYSFLLGLSMPDHCENYWCECHMLIPVGFIQVEYVEFSKIEYVYV